MKKHSHSLLARIAVAHALVAVLVVGLVIALFVHANNIFMHHIMYRQIRGYSHALFDIVAANADPAAWARLAAEHRADLIVRTETATFAFDDQGAVRDPEQLRESTDVDRWFEVTADNHAKPAYTSGVTSIEVAWPRRMGAFAQFHVFASYGVLLLGILGAAHWYFRSQLRPLRALRDGVEAVARGDFTSEVPVVRPDEIGQFTEAFNDMTRRVARMMADREQLLADVSHELRSPLARVKVALELLDDDEKTAVRRSIQDDVREMESLITVLLERARLASTEDGARLAEVDLAELVRRAVEVVGHRHPGVVLELDPRSWVVQGDAALLRMLVHNLLDNALKFSREDSEPVRLRLLATAEPEPKGEPEGVALEVIDDGIGLDGPPGAVERIFEPFVKLDRARGHRSGFGLGLDLCRRIVALHGGSIELGATAEGGTRARVVLPR